MGRSQGRSRRSPGAEFRAVLWIVRHPGMAGAPVTVTAAVNEFGPTPVGVAAGAVGLGLGAWYRGHPDTFDTVAAPVLRAWRRRWAGAYVGRRWSDLMASCELTRIHPRTGRLLVPRVLRVRSWSPFVDTVRVRLVPGQSVRAVADRIEELADTLKAERVAVERGRPGEVVLIVQRDEPFTHAIPSPELPEEVADVDLKTLYLGEDEFGRDFTEPLYGTHFFRAGATGSGKNSVVAQRLRAVAPLIRDGLVRPWVIDPKMLEWSWLAPVLDGRYAANPADGHELIEAFVANMERKQKRMQRAGIRSAPVCPEYPVDWLILDEVGFLMAYRPDYAHGITEMTSVIASLGRSTHDVVEALVQEPAKDVVPIRELLPHRLCLRVTAESHPDMVLGDGMRARGALADQIDPGEHTAGIGYAIAPRSRYPRRIRVAYTDDAQTRELVEFVRPPLRAAS